MLYLLKTEPLLAEAPCVLLLRLNQKDTGMKKIYLILAVAMCSNFANAQVVISQVYGGGGNSGATYTHDFIELFNRGNTAVTLSGYTLQYSSATGAFSATNRQTLPDITIQPGKYYLIQEAKGSGGTTPLPAPDLITTEEGNNVILALSGTNGKVALANNSTLVTSATDANVVDLVGYGTANVYEGAGAVAALTNTTAALRNNDGCADTNSNSSDFTTAAPAPRNSSTPAHSCSLGTGDFEAPGVSIYPNPVSDGILHIVAAAGDKAVSIYDMLGKQVLFAITDDALSTASLNPGIYIVKITMGDSATTKKLIIK